MDICRVVDPWAGSYYVEYLTKNLADRAWDLIQEVEQLGGMTKAIETGVPKMRIEEARPVSRPASTRASRPSSVLTHTNSITKHHLTPLTSTTRQSVNHRLRV